MLRDLAKFVFRNAQLKLVALTIAVVIWVYANYRLTEEASVTVPLNARLPAEFRIVYQSHRKVQLRLRGPHYLVKRRQDEAAQESLVMTANLKAEDFEQGVARLKPDPAWLNVPERELVQTGVTILQQEPVRVYASEIVSRQLPVEVQLSEKPRSGYEVRGCSAVPAEVTVVGPAMVLDGMTALKTHEISVWDAQSDLRRVVPLVLQKTVTPEEGVEVTVALEAEPPQVAVHIEIAGEKEQRRLDGIAVQLLEPPDFPYLAEIDPDERYVSVTVAGLPQDIARVTSSSVTAYVDLRGLQQVTLRAASEPYKEKVQLLLPDDIPLSAGPPEPAQVTVVVKRRSP